MICPGCRRDSRSTDYCDVCMRQFTESDVAAIIAASPAGMQGGFPAKPMAPQSVGIPPSAATAAVAQQPAAPLSGAPGVNPSLAPMSPPPSSSMAFNPAAPVGGAYNPGLAGPPAAPPVNPLTQPGTKTQEMPLPNYLQPTISMTPAQPQVQVRMSLTGEVIEEAAPMPPQPTVGMPPSPFGAPVGGHATPPARSIHGSRVATAAAGGVEAVKAELLKQQFAEIDREVGLRWERALAVIMPSVAISLAIAHFVPDSYVWVGCFSFFMVGLGLGATRAIVPFEEAYLDCTAILAVSFVCGPVAGIAAYLLVGLIKQEWNMAALAVLVGHIIVRVAFAIAFPDAMPWFTIMPYFKLIDPIGMVSFMGTALSFAGWMLSSFFRSVNE